MPAAVEVRVYGPSGAGAFVAMSRRRSVRWLDELNAVGFGSFQVHASDVNATAANLAHGRIVKYLYAGAERFAFRIEKRLTQVVSTEEDAGRWTTVSGRGVTSLLGDAVIYPEYGLTRASSDERRFTFASKTGDWYVAAEWVAPLGVRQDADPTARAKNPADWPDPAAQWIWPTDPTISVPEGEVAYFRGSFTLAAAASVKVYATADNFYELFLNGEQILTSDPADLFAWRTTGVYTVVLPAGTHLLAARAQNLAGGGANPAAFLCTVAAVDGTGVPTSFLLRTEPASWLTHTAAPVPGWRAAHILSALLAEAQARAVTACTYLTKDFTAAADSAAVAWTDRQDLAVRVGVESVLDVSTKLAESTIDLAVNPAMVLQAWKRRGVDRTASVTLAKGVSLVDHKVTSTAPTATRLLVRDALGWSEAIDTAGEAAAGRREAGLQLGGAQSQSTASMIASSTFAETATARQIIESGQIPPRTGVTPYVDFGIGDDVLTLGEDGTNVPVRVASLSLEEGEDGNIRFTPELFV